LVEVTPDHFSACHHIDKIPALKAELANMPSIDEIDDSELLAKARQDVIQEHQIVAATTESGQS
jgi:hypothetical protein